MPDKKEKSLVKRAGESFILNQVSRLFEFGFTFVFSIILARGMGPEKLGTYATVFSFVTLFALASSLGFDELLNTYIPKERNNPGHISYLMRRIILYRFVLLIVAAGLIYLLAEPIGYLFAPDVASKGDLAHYLRISVFFIITGNLSAPFVYLFTGLLKMRVVALMRLLTIIINVSLAYIFLVVYKQTALSTPMFPAPNEIGITIGILTFTSILALVVYIPVSLPKLLVKQEKFKLRPLFSFGITLWLINFVNYVLSKQSDIMVMGLNRIGGAEIGFYHTAYNLSQYVNTILLAGLFGISLAVLAEAEATKGRKALVDVWRFLIKFSSIVSVPVMIWMLVYSPPIIFLFFGAEYIPAVVPFIVYSSFGVMGRLLGGGINITTMYVVNREKIALLLRLICGALNLLLDIILIPSLKALGAVIATGTAGVVLMIAELILAKITLKGQFPVKFTIKMLVACAIGVAASLVVPVNWQQPVLWQLICSGLLYMMIFLVAMRFLRIIEPEDWELLEKISPRIKRVMSLVLGEKTSPNH